MAPSLPRPVAVLAHNDVRGRHLVESCAEIGLSVPDNVAVLGIDNEPPFCEVCQPPLSSIVPNAERVGYEAGASLEKLMGGGPAEPCVLVPPQGIVVRQSTDVTAVSDPLVANAVRFIREHACEGIGVADVMAHAVTSRTWLDQRFRQFLGHTPHDEILRVRLKRACQLLEASDLTLDVVAERSGFRHGAYLVEVFLREFGQTPGEYRDAKKSLVEKWPSLKQLPRGRNSRRQKQSNLRDRRAGRRLRDPQPNFRRRDRHSPKQSLVADACRSGKFRPLAILP